MLLSKINLYLAKEYTRILLKTLACMIAVVFLLDLAENLRVSSGYKSIKTLDLMTMTVSKCCSNMTRLMPLGVLIATAATFLILGKRNEMMVFCTLQVSKTRMIMIVSGVLLIFYIFFLFVFLSINSSLSAVSGRIKDRLQPKGQMGIYLAENGIFFKNFSKGYFFIRAEKMNRQANEMFKVTIWELDGNFSIKKTIIADKALIKDQKLVSSNAIGVGDKASVQEIQDFVLDFKISPKNIISSLGSPEQISILRLPSFMRILSDCGFPIAQYEKYFYSNITIILSFLAMALIGFISSFHLVTRFRDNKKFLYGAALGGAALFTNDLLMTLFLNKSYSIMVSVLVSRLVILSIVIFLIKGQKV